jgi:hypothetical protein
MKAATLAWCRWIRSACGPLRSFVGGCFLDTSARRGRRYPVWAHAVAVGAAHRLHCAARSGVAPQNSLRSLRSLRSDSRGESDDEARAARAPTPALRCSSPQKSPPPGTARREVHRLGFSPASPLRWLQRRVRAGRRAPLRCREAQGSWPRAQRASTSDSSPLFERSERSERSEFGDGPRDRASQGSRCAAPTTSAKPAGLPACAFAALNNACEGGCRRSAQRRDQPLTGRLHFVRRTSRVARVAKGPLT